MQKKFNKKLVKIKKYKYILFKELILIKSY